MSTNVRSTAASGSGIYESQRAVDEYLLFHYGSPALLMPYAFGPVNALHFADRVANLAFSSLGKAGEVRALDVGCAVGGLSFALARHCKEVVGLDYSHSFVDAAKTLQTAGRMPFTALKQGAAFVSAEAAVPADIDRSRVSFVQGDACALPEALGQFDLIVASNLLCRLPRPAQFLKEAPAFLRPGGVLVLVSPYSWLEEYTPQEHWMDWQGVQDLLGGQQLELEHEEEVPFLIREHERKFQFGVSHGSVWRKRRLTN